MIAQLAELRSILPELERRYAVLRSEGNPNHKGSGSGGGQFTSGGGGGGSSKPHGKHWAKRQRRKAKKLEKLRKEGHEKFAKLREKHRGERSQKWKDQRDKGASYKDRQGSRAALREQHREERKAALKEHVAKVHKEVGKANPDNAKVQDLRGRRSRIAGRVNDAYAADVAKTVETHGKRQAEMGERHSAERTGLMEDLKSERSEIREKFAQEKADVREGIKTDYKEDVANAKGWAANPKEAKQAVEEQREFYRKHAKEVMSDVRQEQRDVLEQHREDAREAWKSLAKSQSDDRKGQHQSFKIAMASWAKVMRETRQQVNAKAKSEVQGRSWGENSARRETERGSSVSRAASKAPVLRIGKGKLQKANSAETILGTVLRRRGWTRRYNEGRLTGRQHLALLEDVRQYGRQWLRHEAEVFFGRHGDEDRTVRSLHIQVPDECGRLLENAERSESVAARTSPGEAERSLSGRVLSPLKRWFDRMRSFVHELVVAGALAMSGPDGLSDADVAALDRNAKVQRDYLDRFERELIANPPPEITASGPDFGTVTILANPPMTVGQVVARAESYGSSVWQSTLNVGRSIVATQGVFQAERRVHYKAAHEHHYCQTCIEQSRLGWQPLGSLNEIGDSECMSNCDCYFEWMAQNDPKIYVSPWGRHNPKGFNPKKGPGIAYPKDSPDLPNPNDQGGGSTIPGEPAIPPGPLTEQQLKEIIGDMDWKATIVVGEKS